MNSKASQITRTTLLVVFGLVWLVPVYLFVINASKSPTTYNSHTSWIPGGFALLSNIAAAWKLSDLGGSIVSTLLYAVVAPSISVVVGAAVGFAIVALQLRHGFAWFVFVFGGTIFPLQMILIPLFDGYSHADLYDTRTGMVLIYTAISVPFAAFVMRNFFTGVSYNVYEAAVVDGASAWRIFTRIYLPMALSALVAIFILQATFVWNDLLLGLTLAQSDSIRPVVTNLSELQTAYGGAQISTVLAAGVLVSLPTVVLFLFTQRYFSRGLALGQY